MAQRLTLSYVAVLHDNLGDDIRLGLDYDG